jgi:DNA ligase-3
VADPKKAPVWEIIGAEFSKADIHTADGISIRFPRIQKMRDDKTWKEATDLPRLQVGLCNAELARVLGRSVR